MQTPEQALRALMYETSLFQAHPIIVQGVREGIVDLLRTLGRDDLIPLWCDEQALFAVSTVVAPLAPADCGACL